MSTVKSNYQGQSVNFQGKKVTLTKDLSQSLASEMINAGLGHYFEGNPKGDKKERPVIKLEVVKKGGNGDAIEKGFNEPAEPAGAKSVPYSKQKNDDLIALIAERGLELGEAKTKAELVAILEADDNSNA